MTSSLDMAKLGRLLNGNEYDGVIKQVHRADVLPYLFRLRGEPYSLEDYPQFREMYPSECVADTIFMCGRQIGKSASEDDLCRLDNGLLRRLGDITVGDMTLAMSDSHKIVPRKVTAKHDHGIQKVWRIRTRLGADFSCTKEHRLRTVESYKILNTLRVGSRIAAPRRGGVFTGAATIPSDRIILTAYMIGDGCCTSSYHSFTNACKTVVNEFCSHYTGAFCANQRKRSPCTTQIALKKQHPLHKWLAEDGLSGHYAYDKFVPDWVFDLSRKNTILFMSRLWATDGSIKLHNGFPEITYSTTSRLLAVQLVSLLNKLGMLVAVREKETLCEGKRCRMAHELRIEGPKSQKLFLKEIIVPGKPAVTPAFAARRRSNRDTVPLEIHSTLKRIFGPKSHRRDGKSMRRYAHADLRIKPRYPLTYEKLAQYIRYAKWANISQEDIGILQDIYDGDIIWDEITSITYAGRQQTYDLSIETYPNYVCGGIVTHNSMNLSRSEVLDLISIPHFQLLFVAPLQSQTQRYSTLYLRESIASCQRANYLQSDASTHLSDGQIVKSVHHQAFGNGSGIQLTYAKTSSDRARGIFADRIDFDEIQDQLVDNIPIISESLTASDWGLRRFTGTAKTTDNTIEALWQDSSMCEWAMKCSGCNHWNIPNVEGDVLSMIKSDGVHCVKCGKLLNVRRGQMVPAHPSRMDEFRGFHIPQIVVPAIVENPVKWSALMRKVLRLPLPIIMQEVLGISCSIGARLITQEDITRQSVLPSVTELQKKLHNYVFTVGGVDWGIAEHQSFTVHTIIGVKPDGKIDVLWARRFVGFDPDETLKAIAQAQRFYRCRMLAADFGVGFDKNIMLERRFGLPVVQIMYVKQNRLLNYNPILGHHRWTVDKVTALELMFLAIRYGKIRFPPQGEFKIYTDDLLSPYEELVESGGLTHRKFARNPNRPDDFAHALCFSTMLAMRLMNSDIINVVPAHAMGAMDMEGEGTPPSVDHVDPADILAALNV